MHTVGFVFYKNGRGKGRKWGMSARELGGISGGMGR